MSETKMMLKRIGSTTYKVNVYPSQTSKETVGEKIMRIMRNDLKISQKSGIMEVLQAGWLPERSSV